MAVRTDVTFDFTVSPRTVEVKAPSTTITIQDLYDTLASEQAKVQNGVFAVLIKGSGKQNLGSGVRVGVTVELQNTQLAFAARAGPSTVQCTVTGGNLVAIDASAAELNPIKPTAFTQVVVEKSTSASIASGVTLPKKNAALPQFHYVLRDATTKLPKTGITGITGQIAKDGGAFAALTNPSAEVANGVYRVTGGFTAAELNADVATLRFSAVGVDDTILTVVTATE